MICTPHKSLIGRKAQKYVHDPIGVGGGDTGREKTYPLPPMLSAVCEWGVDAQNCLLAIVNS
jgi:hypothetical protein